MSNISRSRVSAMLVVFWLVPSCAGMVLEKGGHIREFGIVPAATISGSSYKVLGRAEGESSTFYLLGLFPVTRPLSISYALNQAVGKVKGASSMVNITVWHETHFYFPLGRVSVVKVSGDAIAWVAPVEETIIVEKPVEKNPPKKKPGRQK